MTDVDDDRLGSAVRRLAALGITRVESYAWRDLDDPDAGGSELHADEIMSRWAGAGVAVRHRTSTIDHPRRLHRHGYDVEQRGGRHGVFARVAARQLVRRRPADVATVEIWNGVPWFGPLWAPQRRVVWLHHVHRDMWSDALPWPADAIGRTVETRLAPPLYRNSRFATLSASSAEGIAALGIDPARIAVIPPGVDERFRPDPAMRCEHPHVVVVGRLAPVKRHVAVLDALDAARDRVPELTVDLVGDGPERARIEGWIADRGAAGWARLLGRVDDAELVAAYRRAWLVVSASHAEGWGMSLTEGAACGTPCVATDIAGHRNAALDGRTGVLVADVTAMGDPIADLLLDHGRREAMSRSAIEYASGLSWTAVAARHLDVLADACAVSRRPTGPG